MKRIILLLILSLSILVFSSCKQEKYTSSLTSTELADELMKQISGSEDYLSYTDEELSYFDFTKDGDADITLLHSQAAEDVGEIGVVRVFDGKSKEMKLALEEYLKDQQKEKGAFFKNYAPGELLKLERAEVRCFGDYVVFTVLSSEESQAVFEKAEEILK